MCEALSLRKNKCSWAIQTFKEIGEKFRVKLNRKLSLLYNLNKLASQWG